MRVSVIIFPGSNCDRDAIHAWSRVLDAEVSPIWHKDHDLKNPDMVFIPGGFSFGDYLRSGAIASLSPIMDEVAAFYKKGGYVMGVCNGFQILCEMGILPGALLTNASLKFVCGDAFIRVESNDSPFTHNLNTGQVLCIPVAHGMGQYYAAEETLDKLEDENQVAFRYCNESGVRGPASNPNGSCRDIAGIRDASGRALGMMPHPERHVESALGSEDGVSLLSGLIDYLSVSV